MPKFVRIARNDEAGSYIESLRNLPGSIAAEFDDLNDLEPGTKFILEVVEMSQEEYEALPEFDGW